ncbi:MAG: hypothetical protein NZM38_06045 [Cytophagales bacterium]|nr:hypothetical protein [Cytophagales bacterium]MDW8384317.1 hypothetical protein [Flammeovirgaceae bacterium]
MKKFSFLIICGISVLLTDCSYRFPDEKNISPVQQTPVNITAQDLGNVNFENYIAIGNSLTAGFMDGALYPEGQMNAYPNLLAERLKEKGLTSSFISPWLPSDKPKGIAFRTSSTELQVLGRFQYQDLNPACPLNGYTPSQTVQTSVLLSSLTSPAGLQPLIPFIGLANNASPLNINNFGIPGITISQFSQNNYGNAQNVLTGANPYYIRFAPSPTFTYAGSVLNHVIVRNPTFFTFWLGNNDALGFALNGGETFGVGGLLYPTSPSSFAVQFEAALDTLLARTSAKGVVFNLPDNTLAAHFRQFASRTSPVYQPFTLTSIEADSLNKIYRYVFGNKAANPGAPDSVYFFANRPNYYMMQVDKFVPGTTTVHTTFRQIIPGQDLPLLGIGAVLDSLGKGNIVSCGQVTPLQRAGWGRVSTTRTTFISGLNISVPTPMPIPDRLILDKDEVATVKSAIFAYNQQIADIVKRLNQRYNNRLSLLDIATSFDRLNQSVDPIRASVENGRMYMDMSPLGFYSSDGIHPTPKGQALIANLLIDFLNARAKDKNGNQLNLRRYELTLFRGNDFPQQ